MIDSVDNVVKWIRENSLQNWQVKSRDQDNSLIFETNDADSLETNISRFRSVMELSKSGRYFIYGSQKESGAKRGMYREEFSSLASAFTSSVSGVKEHFSSVPDGFISRTEFESLMAKERTEMKMEWMERELKDLKEENRELKTPMQEFWRKLAPVAPGVISGLVGHFMPAAPVGIGRLDVEENEMPQSFSQIQPEITEPVEEFLSSEQEQRLSNALTVWSGADDEWLELIEKIATMAASKDPMYATAKGLLLKM